MIAYIKGKIEECGEDYVIIDNNGMGYYISMPGGEIEKVKKNEGIIKIHTYQYVREDAVGLFGFLDREALNIFKMLKNISGVGPKAALSILSAVDPSSIILSIITDDSKTLCKAQGVGKKLAQRIILELKDKFKNYDFTTINTKESVVETNVGESFEAIGALMALGYTRGEAVSAIKSIDSEGKSIEEIVKMSLKVLMRG
jgi:Holliday junction DNA helicase RuvA